MYTSASSPTDTPDVKFWFLWEYLTFQAKHILEVVISDLPCAIDIGVWNSWLRPKYIQAFIFGENLPFEN